MSDQSCGNLEQQWTAVLDDEEMSAVHANYTAYIGDQDKTRHRVLKTCTA